MRSVHGEVKQSVDMNSSDFVYTSPDWANIRSEVCCRTDIETDVHSLVASLKEYNKKDTSCDCSLPYIEHVCRSVCAL